MLSQDQVLPGHHPAASAIACPTVVVSRWSLVAGPGLEPGRERIAEFHLDLVRGRAASEHGMLTVDICQRVSATLQ